MRAAPALRRCPSSARTTLVRSRLETIHQQGGHLRPLLRRYGSTPAPAPSQSADTTTSPSSSSSSSSASSAARDPSAFRAAVLNGPSLADFIRGPVASANDSAESVSVSGARKVFLETYGCQMNSSDSEVVLSIMQKAGYQQTTDVKEVRRIVSAADLCFDRRMSSL